MNTKDKRNAIVVVEAKPSMAVWRKSLNSFSEDLRASDCFSSVFLADLQCVNDEYALSEEVIDVNNAYIFFVTDGVSRGWDSYEIPKLLCSWAQKCVVSILHVLPENLWYSTRCKGVLSSFSASFCVNTNDELLIKDFFRDPMVKLGMRNGESGCYFPIWPFFPNVESNWIDAIILERKKGHAIYLYASPSCDGDDDVHEDLAQLNAEQLVRRFQYLESHSAFELAVFASALKSPLSIPIMDALLQEFIERPNTHHISEFLLGGLLKCDNPEEGNPDALQFSFLREDVRSLLTRQIRRSEFQKILDFLSTTFPDVSVDEAMFGYWPDHFQISLT